MNDDSEGPAGRGFDKQKADMVGTLLTHAMDNQAQYGRWLLASLLAVHGGGLLAITQAGTRAAELFSACGSFLIWGVATALFSGGLAWISFSAATAFQAGVLSAMYEMRAPDPQRFPICIMRFTFYFTPVVAAFSLGLFVWAAMTAAHVLNR